MDDIKDRETNLLDLPSDMMVYEITQVKDHTIAGGKTAANQTLAVKDIARIAKTCSSWHRLFQPYLDNIKAEKVGELFKYVAIGDVTKAESLLKHFPLLTLASGQLMDPSHREFNHITAFQYALWALDLDMCEMLAKYLPPTALKQQLETHEAKTDHAHGKYYRFETLKTALAEYINNVDELSAGECINFWCKRVGMTQKNIPAWLAKKYCQKDNSFLQDPYTLSNPFRFYNSMTGSNASWYPLELSGGLGDTLAVLRNGPGPKCIGVGAAWKMSAEADLSEMTQWCAEREKKMADFMLSTAANVYHNKR